MAITTRASGNPALAPAITAAASVIAASSAAQGSHCTLSQPASAGTAEGCRLTAITCR